MIIQFWSNEPTVLFNKNYISELWPTTDMSYEQKLNAISRLVILITVLGYILTMNSRILFVGLITLVVIFILFKMSKQKITKEMLSEGFEPLPRNSYHAKEDTYVNPVTLDSVLKSEFKEGTKKNPFSNVLLTQISDNPDRKSAPPAFNAEVNETITKNVKKAVQMLNPTIKNTDKQLYGDMWQEFELDTSNRAFYSTPNSRISNDQSAFAEYLYSDMKYSSKEDTPEGALARVQNNPRWTLY